MLKRVKRRYLLVEVESEGVLEERELMDAAWSSVMKLYGEYGASKAALKMIEYDQIEKTLVLRTANDALDKTKAALVVITKVGDKRATLHVMTVSGTLKSLRTKQKNG